MVYKRFFLPFLLVFLLTIIISYSLSFAQYTTYNPTINYQTNTLSYPYYQNNAYAPYQASSYWPNPTGSYIDPYSQTFPYNISQGSYIPSVTNPYTPYGPASPYLYPSLNPGNLFYNSNLLGYAYTPQLYNPFGTIGSLLNSAGIYYPEGSLPNSTTNGTTNSDSSSATTNSYYATQATSLYPAILSGISSALQINPYALPTIPLSGLYLNPFSNYIPNQNYYQNPYASYPYNYGIGQANTLNPYQYQYPFGYPTDPYTNNPINPYNQPTSYTQPLPYYQTNSTTVSSEGNLVNVNGTWAGTWFTTLPDGTVNNGDATISLTQNGTEIYGTISFSLNSYQKFSTNINGIINGTSLTLTGALINGAEIYTLYVKGNISGNNLSGTYSINTNKGSVIESGTYSIAHL